MNREDAIAYVKTGMGFPIIQTFEIKDEDIEMVALNKAVFEYFKRYPLTVHKSYQAGQVITKEMYPGGEKCIGALNINFVPASEFVDPSIDDPFGLSRRLVDLNIDHALPGVFAQRATITALRRPSFSWTKDDITGNIKLASLYDGFFNITWGVMGDITQVPIMRIYDVLDLAVAGLKIYIGQTRMLMKLPEGGVSFDGKALYDDGIKTRDDIFKRWIVIPMLLTIR